MGIFKRSILSYNNNSGFTKRKKVLEFLNIRSRWGWWLLIITTTLWLLWMTLRPDGHLLRNELNLIPMAEHGEAIACLFKSHCFFRRTAWRFIIIDVVGNIIVFMPIGFGLAGALDRGKFGQTIRNAVLGGFAVSLTIELLQLLIPTRTTDVDDLIFNTLGASLGIIIFALFRKKASLRPAKGQVSN